MTDDHRDEFVTRTGWRLRGSLAGSWSDAPPLYPVEPALWGGVFRVYSRGSTG